MPRRLDHARLIAALRNYLEVAGPAMAAPITHHLGISQPTFSRLVAQSRQDILCVGRARATQYAWRRSIPSVDQVVPVYEIDARGKARHCATLHAIQPQGFYVEALVEGVTSAFHHDLPYFLFELRPAGFLGRLLPRRHPELELPPDVRLWSADHCLKYLTRYGWNMSGNFVLGDEAFRLYLHNARTPPDEIESSQRVDVYPAIANDVLRSGAPGSSAGGEQPKFLAMRTPGPVGVLVKFSPPIDDRTGRRWGDLLICEHIAHRILREYGQPAPKSEILIAGDRIFLEVERFDRVGAHGRKGLASLMALDAEFVGSMKSWADTATQLAVAGHIPTKVVEQIRWLERFGRLIGNTDMHPGNLSFFTAGTAVTHMAPAYDMLPMLYAPQHGHAADPPFEPPVPGPGDASIWETVCRAATDFWEAVGAHPTVSEAFRHISRSNAEVIRTLRAMGRLLPAVD